MEIPETQDLFEYQGCYVFIECSEDLFTTKIYGVEDQKFCLSGIDKDIVLLDAMNAVDQYLNQKNTDFICRAIKIPDLGSYNYLEYSRSGDSISTKDRLSFYHAMVKYGFKNAMNFAFSGIFLHKMNGYGVLDLSRFLDPKKDVRFNKQLVLLPGLKSNYVIEFTINGTYGIIGAFPDQNRGLLRIEFDCNKVSYEIGYEFNLYVDGVRSDTGQMQLNKTQSLIECEIIGCDKIFSNISRIFRVALLDDYYLLNDLLVKNFEGCFESNYEIMKCQLAAFIRYVIMNEPNNEEIKNYFEKNNVKQFVQFFYMYGFVYDDIKSIDIQNVDFKLYADSVKKYVNDHTVKHYHLFELLSRHKSEITEEIFNDLRQKISQYDFIGKQCDTSAESILAYKICWKYVLNDSLMHKIYFEIINIIVDGNYKIYADILNILCLKVASIEEIASQFNVTKGFDNLKNKRGFQSIFIYNRLNAIEKIAISEKLPFLYRKKGSEKNKNKRSNSSFNCSES